MIESLGSKWFTINHEDIVDGDFMELNYFLIESKNDNSKQHLYIYQDQIDDLIDLLQKTKEIFNKN